MLRMDLPINRYHHGHLFVIIFTAALRTRRAALSPRGVGVVISCPRRNANGRGFHVISTAAGGILTG